MIINATGFQSQSRNRAETGSLFNRDDEKNIKNIKKEKIHFVVSRLLLSACQADSLMQRCFLSNRDPIFNIGEYHQKTSKTKRNTI
jgi:hypothetical protein